MHTRANLYLEISLCRRISAGLAQLYIRERRERKWYREREKAKNICPVRRDSAEVEGSETSCCCCWMRLGSDSIVRARATDPTTGRVIQILRDYFQFIILERTSRASSRQWQLLMALSVILFITENLFVLESFII